MGWRRAPDREPACRLVRFEAPDGVGLAGLLYEPLVGRASARRAGLKPGLPALIWLHGTGGASVFESRRTNLLAAELLARGIAFFPFNNRGAHIVRRAGDVLGGAAFERIRDCVFDIDGAVRELRRRGYRELYLAGHSTGANKVAVYDRLRPRNRIKRYILLAGGDDTALMKATAAQLARARAMIRARRGNELMPGRLMSWRAFYDVANPRGDYNVFAPPWRQIKRIRKPSLYIYGDRDEYAPDVAALAEQVGVNAEIVVLEDTDHGFTGREGEVGQLIGEWLLA
jgi:pimeloyl-ACP methyl ester carboxylesterase